MTITRWVALLFLMFLVGCYHQETVQHKLEQELGLELVAIGLAREMASGHYKLITTKELHEKLKADGGWLLVDVRALNSYRRGHIPGAVNFSFPKGVIMDAEWNLKLMDGRRKEDFTEFLGRDKHRLLIFSCGRTRCERGHNAALWAVRLGYTNVFRHPGGVDAWAGAGFGITQ